MFKKISALFLTLSCVCVFGCDQFFNVPGVGGTGTSADSVKVVLEWEPVPFGTDSFVDLDLHVVGDTASGENATSTWGDLVQEGRFHVWAFHKAFNETTGSFWADSVFTGAIGEYSDLENVPAGDLTGAHSTTSLDHDVNNLHQYTPGVDPETITIFDGAADGVYTFTVFNCDNVDENGSWFDAAPKLKVYKGATLLQIVSCPAQVGEDLSDVNAWKALKVELNGDNTPVITVENSLVAIGDETVIGNLDW